MACAVTRVVYKEFEMKQVEVLELIRQYFLDAFEIEPERVVPEARLFDDLELDSIDALDMVGMLESKLDIDVEESALKGIRTVGDVVEYILEKAS